MSKEKKPSYWEMLRDPRWQRKRLEVMDRAGFQCEECGNTTTIQNVHHKYYERGLAPWEYPTGSLSCLCEPCHKSAQDQMAVLQREIGLTPVSNVGILIGWLRASRSTFEPDIEVVVEDEKQAEGVALFYLLTTNEVLTIIAQTNGESCLSWQLWQAAKERREGRSG